MVQILREDHPRLYHPVDDPDYRFDPPEDPVDDPDYRFDPPEDEARWAGS